MVLRSHENIPSQRCECLTSEYVASFSSSVTSGIVAIASLRTTFDEALNDEGDRARTSTRRAAHTDCMWLQPLLRGNAASVLIEKTIPLKLNQPVILAAGSPCDRSVGVHVHSRLLRVVVNTENEIILRTTHRRKSADGRNSSCQRALIHSQRRDHLRTSTRRAPSIHRGRNCLQPLLRGNTASVVVEKTIPLKLNQP